MTESSIIAIISSITAFFAIIAPVIVAKINNKHALDIQDVELIYNSKVATFKEFLVAYGRFMSLRNYVNKTALGEATSKAIIYASPAIRNHLLSMLDVIFSGNDKYDKMVSPLEYNYKQLVPLIYEEITKN